MAKQWQGGGLPGNVEAPLPTHLIKITQCAIIWLGDLLYEILQDQTTIVSAYHIECNFGEH